MNNFATAEPFLPGEYVKDELDARGWTHDDLSEVIGMSRRQVINLIQGKSRITAETAQLLAAAFEGQTAQSWMNLQASYDLALAARDERETSRRAKVFTKVPVRELKRRLWLPAVSDIDHLETAVCRLLDINSLDDEPSLSHAARKGSSYDFDTSAQIAWYCRARQLAERVSVKNYEESNIDEGLRDLVQLSADPQDLRKVPALLAEMGIRFVVIQHLQKTKVDGVAIWLDDRSPAIALSLRFDRIDNFWFTLLHELSHLKNRDTTVVDVDVAASQLDENLPASEKRANLDASQWLITNEKIESFIRRSKPLYYEKRVIQFAQANGIHPGIVVGQLQNRNELGFQQLRKLLVKVRSEIIGQALTDGWGNTHKE